MSAMTLLEQAEFELALSAARTRELEIRDLFSKLDKDLSGFIDRDELKPLLTNMGFDEALCTHAGFERFLSEEFKLADTSGDQKIDFGEFVVLHNSLQDTKKDIQHLNFAISLVDTADTLSSEDYLVQLERLSAANKSVHSMTTDVVAALDSIGDKPSPEVLQVFTCILILFGLPERDTPEEDWSSAQALFDAPNFLDDLKTFDRSKLRRAQVHRCIQRSQPLVQRFRKLEKEMPLVYSLLCWVLITLAAANKDGVLDQVDEEENLPIQKRSSFLFSLGTTARKGMYRILDSDLFDGDFHRKRDPGSAGITLQVGRLESNSKEAISAIIFDRSKFTEEQAAEWCATHKEQPQFATALEAMASPRVDVQNFDFSFDDSSRKSSAAAAAAAAKAAGDKVEKWGYNDDGEFVMTLVSKAELAGKTSADHIVESIQEALVTLTDETVTAFGELPGEDPGHGEASVSVVAMLVGDKEAPASWLDAKMWCLNPGRVQSMKSLDLRKMSRIELHRRIRNCSKYFLDPTLSPALLMSGNPVVYSMIRWAKAVIIAAEHPDVVKAGRDVDAKGS